MLKRLLSSTCAALLAASLAPRPVASAEPAAAAGRPSFAGSWTLNPELSDDAEAKVKEARSERRRGGRGPIGIGPMGAPTGGGPMAGGPVGGPMGGPGMSSTMGAPPDPQEVERLRGAMEDVMAPPASLLVSQEGVAFEIVSEGDRIDRLYADGRKNKGSSGVERKTRWAADTLVTEAKLGGGFGGPQVKITETWSLVDATPSASRLAITTRLEGGLFEKPLVLKRLYDRALAP